LDSMKPLCECKANTEKKVSQPACYCQSALDEDILELDVRS
jgi:hypothetical protein